MFKSREWLVVANLFIAGCGGVQDERLGEEASETAEIEEVDEFGEALMNSAIDVSVGIPGVWSTGQSETAVLATGSYRYVAYNAHDPAKVTILPNDGGRVVCKGATGTGYSYSADDGATWTAGKLTLPNSWFMSWGDPALTVAGSGANRKVFLTTIGLTQAQFDALPAGMKTPQGCLKHDTNGGIGNFAPIAASIWRASPGGAFSLVGTVSSADLDGGSAIAIGDTAYFAYWNVGASTALVAKNGIAGGASLIAPPPFTNVSGHAVLVKTWIDNEAAVTAVVPTSNTNLELATYKPSSNTWTPKTTIATNYSSADVTIGNKSIRGRGFTAHYRGANGPVTNLVVTYQFVDQGKTRLASSLCSVTQPASCEQIPGWTVPETPGFNAFMPALVQRTRPMDGHADYRTYLTYWTDEGHPNGQVRMVFNHLVSDGTQSWGYQGSPQTPCPDSRGYWGDYDHAYSESLGAGVWSRMVRSFTDSTGANCSAQKFIASPQHVSLLTRP